MNIQSQMLADGRHIKTVAFIKEINVFDELHTRFYDHVVSSLLFNEMGVMIIRDVQKDVEDAEPDEESSFVPMHMIASVEFK